MTPPLIDQILLSRTLRIRTESEIGTAFLVEYAEGTYMASAAHLFEQSSKKHTMSDHKAVLRVLLAPKN